jgi:Protein of unknown function (DUF2726)
MTACLQLRASRHNATNAIAAMESELMNTLSSWGWPAGIAAVSIVVTLALLAWFVMQRAAPVVHSGRQRPFRMEDWQPRTMRPLTPDELRVLKLLRKALPECLLMPQVALARFLSVHQNRSYNQWFGSVGRRCVDFLLCSEQGDVLGVIQLQSSKAKALSEGTIRKLKALEMAHIPVWQMAKDDLPDVQALRAMVMPELHAAEQHSMQQQESEWAATKVEPREFSVLRKKAEDQASKPDRWNQAWPTEEARSSAFLDEWGMIEVPPLVVKGSGRSATGFTRG